MLKATPKILFVNANFTSNKHCKLNKGLIS